MYIKFLLNVHSLQKNCVYLNHIVLNKVIGVQKYRSTHRVGELHICK